MSQLLPCLTKGLQLQAKPLANNVVANLGGCVPDTRPPRRNR
jgi:hypothetical protein